jgi:hypothetical protein
LTIAAEPIRLRGGLFGTGNGKFTTEQQENSDQEGKTISFLEIFSH